MRARFGDDGKEREAFYDGVNFNVNARMRNGLFVSIGTQTGRRVDDRCNVVRRTSTTPPSTGPNPRDCRDIDPWETTIRGLGSYTIPKMDVLVSATVRSQPPLQLDGQLAGAEHHGPRRCSAALCRRGCSRRATRRST